MGIQTEIEEIKEEIVATLEDKLDKEVSRLREEQFDKDFGFRYHDAQGDDPRAVDSFASTIVEAQDFLEKGKYKEGTKILTQLFRRKKYVKANNGIRETGRIRRKEALEFTKELEEEVMKAIGNIFAQKSTKDTLIINREHEKKIKDIILKYRGRSLFGPYQPGIDSKVPERYVSLLTDVEDRAQRIGHKYNAGIDHLRSFEFKEAKEKLKSALDEIAKKTDRIKKLDVAPMNDFLTEYIDECRKDVGRLQKARSADKRENYEKAREEYLRILVNNPNSPVADIAREGVIKIDYKKIEEENASAREANELIQEYFWNADLERKTEVDSFIKTNHELSDEIVALKEIEEQIRTLRQEGLDEFVYGNLDDSASKLTELQEVASNVMQEEDGVFGGIVNSEINRITTVQRCIQLGEGFLYDQDMSKTEEQLEELAKLKEGLFGEEDHDSVLHLKQMKGLFADTPEKHHKKMRTTAALEAFNDNLLGEIPPSAYLFEKVMAYKADSERAIQTQEGKSIMLNEEEQVVSREDELEAADLLLSTFNAYKRIALSDALTHLETILEKDTRDENPDRLKATSSYHRAEFYHKEISGLMEDIESACGDIWEFKEEEVTNIPQEEIEKHAVKLERRLKRAGIDEQTREDVLLSPFKTYCESLQSYLAATSPEDIQKIYDKIDSVPLSPITPYLNRLKEDAEKHPVLSKPPKLNVDELALGVIGETSIHDELNGVEDEEGQDMFDEDGEEPPIGPVPHKAYDALEGEGSASPDTEGKKQILDIGDLNFGGDEALSNLFGGEPSPTVDEATPTDQPEGPTILGEQIKTEEVGPIIDADGFNFGGDEGLSNFLGEEPTIEKPFQTDYDNAKGLYDNKKYQETASVLEDITKTHSEAAEEEGFTDLLNRTNLQLKINEAETQFIQENYDEAKDLLYEARNSSYLDVEERVQRLKPYVEEMVDFCKLVEMREQIEMRRKKKEEEGIKEEDNEGVETKIEMRRLLRGKIFDHPHTSYAQKARDIISTLTGEIKEYKEKERKAKQEMMDEQEKELDRKRDNGELAMAVRAEWLSSIEALPEELRPILTEYEPQTIEDEFDFSELDDAFAAFDLGEEPPQPATAESLEEADFPEGIPDLFGGDEPVAEKPFQAEYDQAMQLYDKGKYIESIKALEEITNEQPEAAADENISELLNKINLQIEITEAEKEFMQENYKLAIAQLEYISNSEYSDVNERAEKQLQYMRELPGLIEDAKFTRKVGDQEAEKDSLNKIIAEYSWTSDAEQAGVRIVELEIISEGRRLKEREEATREEPGIAEGTPEEIEIYDEDIVLEDPGEPQPEEKPHSDLKTSIASILKAKLDRVISNRPDNWQEVSESADNIVSYIREENNTRAREEIGKYESMIKEHRNYAKELKRAIPIVDFTSSTESEETLTFTCYDAEGNQKVIPINEETKADLGDIVTEQRGYVDLDFYRATPEKKKERRERRNYRKIKIA